MFEQLMAYQLRILPGAIFTIAFLCLLPRNLRALRIMSYIFFFLLLRDAMTPLGFWSFGSEGGFWIRFAPQPWLLVSLGGASLLLVLVIYKVETSLKELVSWFIGRPLVGILVGILAVLVISGPLLVVYQFVPIANRGGSVPLALLGPILVVTLSGNLWEELLFRGYLQGYLLKRGVSPLRSAFLAGTGFAFGHIFLASTVTAIGAPLLLFAWYEGVIVSLVRMRYGVIPATLAHGLTIAVLTSGLF